MGHFDTLCEASPTARAAQIEAIRAEDPALADTLMEMLAADATPMLDIAPALTFDTPTLDALTLPERYVAEGVLGEGGMGEVLRVRDVHLNRTVAMKIIRADAVSITPRFIEEAQVIAQLQHPGIVPIHDLGRLDDGRTWFTMREVRGQTWHAVLSAARTDPVWRREQIQVLWQVCQAVAFAHEQGVVHRDLKPSNIMIGDYGDVMVLDWGLARLLEGSMVQSSQRDMGALMATGSGIIMGTPMYMAPEQALGEVRAIGPPTDVYALGAILYAVLSGRPPFDANSTPSTVLTEVPLPLDARLPDTLRTLSEQAMQRDPADRPQTAGAMADVLSSWLTGAADRARALELVTQAETLGAQANALVGQERELRASAATLLAEVPLHAPAEEKVTGWANEDAAQGIANRRVLLEAERLQRVHAALNLAPELPEARAIIANHHRAAAERAEQDRDATTAAVHLTALTAFDDGAHADWLAGRGDIRVQTEPSGLPVRVRRWRQVARRRTPGGVAEQGPSPLLAARVEAGDYLVEITRDERPIFAPVRLPRCSARTLTIAVPPAEVLLPNACYVPAGDFDAGGDPDAPDAFARTPVHVPGFIMRRDPVTHREFIAFLDALVADGKHKDAQRWAPREPASGSNLMVYRRDADGRFHVGADAEGVVWHLDEPVVQITWHAAMAWCRWHQARTGFAWRLPHELEWEKAARGTDGRWYPWGDAFDPSWTRMLRSVDGKPARCVVDAYPSDVSPYGVRGMGGNVRDLCLNVWSKAAAPRHLTVYNPATDDAGLRSTRGGSFFSQAHFCRPATRFAMPPDQGFASVGFRPCFSWPLFEDSL